MQIIEEVKLSGFDIWVDGGNIRYKQKSDLKIDKDWLNNALAKIKAHRNKAIQYLQKLSLENDLMAMYEVKLTDIAGKYESGGLDWLHNHYIGLYAAIQKAEDKLNEIWNQTVEGKGRMDNFKSALYQWYRVQMKGIEHYKQCKINHA